MIGHELYQVAIHYNVQIPVRDGLKLSANVFMPVSRQPGERFPAVLEMIPYRKDDWRFRADHGRMTYLAQRGYVGCRLDVRGTGSSPGIALDEYTAAETQDGYDAVEWLAAQPWSNGRVGMWGISYGGFTAIQVAALRPPSLKAIVPMYATDDRYTDDVHYIGGCLTASEFAQYAVSQIGMNALPPKIDTVQADWAAAWRERLEQTPLWILEWLRHQTDGPYWRSGSLAPDYERIQCAIFHIGGWADGYTNPVLRMQEKCVNAPRKALIGPWVHSLPDHAYPGPNIDWLHEMVRFFDYWLKDVDNGVMDEPPLTIFRRDYTPPGAFPARMNGSWHSEAAYPIERMQPYELFLGSATLASNSGEEGTDHYPHRPAWGTAGPLCWGAGGAPSGLARDVRPDESLSLTYTSEPLPAAMDVIGFPEAVLYLSSTAPVAHVAVRLADVAPDEVSSLVTMGILNLTHRNSHSQPEPLTPGQVYEVHVPLKAAGYRFLPGHRIRLSVASASWPIIWPSPYATDNTLHRGPATPSRLILPVVPPAETPLPPSFKTTPPELADPGWGTDEEPVWTITQDVIRQQTRVEIYGGDTTNLPDGASLFNSEKLLLTAHDGDPAHVSLRTEVEYRLQENGYEAEVEAIGSIHSTEGALHVDVELVVRLNGRLFFQRSWLESISRQLL